MDLLTDELERMANNVAEYDGDERDSDIPLDAISDGPPPQRHIPDASRSPAKGAADRKPNGPKKTKVSYLMRLSGQLSTPSQVQVAAGLPTTPALVQGVNDDGDAASFCHLSQDAVAKLEAWLLETGVAAHKRPTFVRLSEADKDLSNDSPYPTLRIDTTLPQHRPNSGATTYHPLQDEYPVWYFFYGTLADPDKLRSLFALAEGDRPLLPRTAVRGATIRTWAGKYKALIDGEGRVEGWAYLVMSKEQEDILRAYETEKYEIVRCRIEIDGEKDVMECTFRFIDPFYLDPVPFLGR